MTIILVIPFNFWGDRRQSCHGGGVSDIVKNKKYLQGHLRAHSSAKDNSQLFYTCMEICHRNHFICQDIIPTEVIFLHWLYLSLLNCYLLHVRMNGTLGADVCQAQMPLYFNVSQTGTNFIDPTRDSDLL